MTIKVEKIKLSFQEHSQERFMNYLTHIHKKICLNNGFIQKVLLRKYLNLM